MNIDDQIEAGFAALKAAQPTRLTQDIDEAGCQRARVRMRYRATAVSAVGVVVLIAAVALRPESAIAALTQAAQKSGRRPVIHFHFQSWQSSVKPTTPPWPERSASDIWRLPDRLIRREGNSLAILRPNGEILSHDDRFPIGHRGTYDAAHDQIWSIDGTIKWALSHYRNPPTVRRGQMTEYTFEEIDGVGNHSTDIIDVDPSSKLVRTSRSENLAPNGDRSGGNGVISYPELRVAERDVPRFPKGLKFVTTTSLKSKLQEYVCHPAATTTVGGIRVALCAVVVYPNVPDGVGIGVVTTGGAIPEGLGDESTHVLGQKLMRMRRTEWLGITATRFIRPVRYGGRECRLNQSDELLFRAPHQVTVRVPVWNRLGRLVGYARFVTSRLVYNVGESSLEDGGYSGNSG